MITLVCEVCGDSSDSERARCGRCGWELRDSEFLGSLEDLEEERYLGRRDLVRVRWKELGQYDQTPRRGSRPAEGTIIRGAATTPDDLAIGGGLL